MNTLTQPPKAPPKHLDDHGKTAWRWAFRELEQAGRLASVDSGAMILYAESEQMKHLALAEIKKTGLVWTTTSREGEVRMRGNPAEAQLDRASRRSLAALESLGLTAKARQKWASIAPEKIIDAFSEYD